MGLGGLGLLQSIGYIVSRPYLDELIVLVLEENHTYELFLNIYGIA